MRPRIDGLWRLDRREAGAGGAKCVTAARSGQRGRPVGRGGAAGRRAARTRRPGSASSRARHIVVRKLFEHDRCYIFQNADGRIVFAIPYEDDFTLIGTTDLDYTGRPGGGRGDRGRDRLSLRRGERIFRTAGPTRRRRLDLFGRAPALRRRRLQGAGGDARLRAEPRRACRRRRRCCRSSAARSRPTAGSPKPRSTSCTASCRPPAPTWTADAPLPGRRFPGRRLRGARRRDPAGASLSRRPPCVRASCAPTARAHARSCDGARGMDDLGQTFGADLTEREVHYLMRDRSGRRGRTTCSGAAPSSACGSRPAKAAALDAFMRQQRDDIAHRRRRGSGT